MSNLHVLQRANTTAQMLDSVRMRQMEIFGQIIRKGTVELLVITEMVESKSGRGRQRTTYVNTLAEESNLPAISLIRATAPRPEWNRMSLSWSKRSGGTWDRRRRWRMFQGNTSWKSISAKMSHPKVVEIFNMLFEMIKMSRNSTKIITSVTRNVADGSILVLCATEITKDCP